MKRFTIIMFAMSVLLLVTAGAAHPPKDVKLEFDIGHHLLNVTAPHDVKDASKHFVGRIEVQLNGQKLTDQKFNSQTTLEMQDAIYKINDAKIGDELTVIASCNITGKKEVTIKVEKKAAPAQGSKSEH